MIDKLLHLLFDDITTVELIEILHFIVPKMLLSFAISVTILIIAIISIVVIAVYSFFEKNK